MGKGVGSGYQNARPPPCLSARDTHEGIDSGVGIKTTLPEAYWFVTLKNMIAAHFLDEDSEAQCVQPGCSGLNCYLLHSYTEGLTSCN